MTFAAAARLLDRHFVEWRPSEEPDRIEAIEESVLDGVLTREWVALPLQPMEILYWLGYCCPQC